MFHWFKKHTSSGLEVPDTTPIEVTLRDRPLTIQEQIARFTRDEVIQAHLRNQGIDTFEEADDFDIPDSEHPKSPYEEILMEDEIPLSHVHARFAEQKAGLVAPTPTERLNATVERFKPKAKAPQEPAQTPVQSNQGVIKS